MTKTTLYLEIAEVQYYTRELLDALKRNDYSRAKYCQILVTSATTELKDGLERIIEQNGKD